MGKATWIGGHLERTWIREMNVMLKIWKRAGCMEARTMGHLQGGVGVGPAAGTALWAAGRLKHAVPGQLQNIPPTFGLL